MYSCARVSIFPLSTILMLDFETVPTVVIWGFNLLLNLHVFKKALLDVMNSGYN
jgi:hypothetical protein